MTAYEQGFKEGFDKAAGAAALLKKVMDARNLKTLKESTSHYGTPSVEQRWANSMQYAVGNARSGERVERYMPRSERNDMLNKNIAGHLADAAALRPERNASAFMRSADRVRSQGYDTMDAAATRLSRDPKSRKELRVGQHYKPSRPYDPKTGRNAEGQELGAPGLVRRAGIVGSVPEHQQYANGIAPYILNGR
jgi:hypothetical protein